MNRKLAEYSAISDLNPTHVGLYLAVKGWRKILDIGDRATVWARGAMATVGQADYQEITLPMRRNFGDFGLRMLEVLNELEQAERRPKTDILRDLMLAPFDVVTVSIDVEDQYQGMPRIEGMQSAIATIHSMMAAAACAAEDGRRPYFEGRSDAARAYLETLRLATEHDGAFSLSVMSRVPGGRGAVMALASALSEIRTVLDAAADGGQGVDALLDAVDDGVNGNLCEALATLGMNSQARFVTIKFTWSPLLPAPALGFTRIVFAGKVMPTIAAAGEQLRRTTPRHHDGTALAVMEH